MRIIWLVAATIALSSCQSKEQAEADRRKAFVSASMKDPESTKYSDLKINGAMLCGKFNSKNSFGAYGGAEEFWSTPGFLSTRNQAVERDAALVGTPANDRWKHGTEDFDRTWDECQKDGVQVE